MKLCRYIRRLKLVSDYIMFIYICYYYVEVIFRFFWVCSYFGFLFVNFFCCLLIIGGRLLNF